MNTTVEGRAVAKFALEQKQLPYRVDKIVGFKERLLEIIGWHASTNGLYVRKNRHGSYSIMYEIDGGYSKEDAEYMHGWYISMLMGGHEGANAYDRATGKIEDEK